MRILDFKPVARCDGENARTSPRNVRCRITRANVSIAGLRSMRAASCVESHGGHRHASQKRGKVILWDDTFVRYHEPHIGIAAVKVLEALGFEVALARESSLLRTPGIQSGKSRCRGKVGQHNVDLLSSLHNATSGFRTANYSDPVSRAIVLVDVCGRLSRAEDRRTRRSMAKRCFLFEKFVDDLLAQRTGRAAISSTHGEQSRFMPHCHAKSIMNPASCDDSPNVCPAGKRRCSIPPVAEWPARSARSQRNTIFPSKSPSI